MHPAHPVLAAARLDKPVSAGRELIPDAPSPRTCSWTTSEESFRIAPTRRLVEASTTGKTAWKGAGSILREGLRHGWDDEKSARQRVVILSAGCDGLG